MNYNFDEIINRKGTNSVKWDAVEGRWGRNDLIPMFSVSARFFRLSRGNRQVLSRLMGWRSSKCFSAFQLNG